jgi:hypothetical protein
MSIPTTSKRNYSEIESSLIAYTEIKNKPYSLYLDPKLTAEQLELYAENAESLGLIVKVLGSVWDLRINQPPITDKENYEQLKQQLDIDRTVIVENIESPLTSSEWFDILELVEKEPDTEIFKLWE